MTWEACDRSAPPRRKLDGARMSARGFAGTGIRVEPYNTDFFEDEPRATSARRAFAGAAFEPRPISRRGAMRRGPPAGTIPPSVRTTPYTYSSMTTVAALVTLGLAFTAPASRLAPPRVSSARMMCAAVMPETPPALESDCGFVL